MHSPSILAVLSTLATVATSAKSAGCGKDLPPKFTTDHTAALKLPNYPGSRTYRLHLPSNYNKDTTHPLYFSFHGAGGTAQTQEELSQFSDPTLFDPHGIVLYPQARGDGAYWLSNPGADTSPPNDLDFTAALLDHMEDLLCVDTSRVYAAGKSNGGGFSAVLACNDTVGGRFAAFAGVSAAFYPTEDIPGVGACSPSQRSGGLPFLEFHGTLDTTAPIDGETPDEAEHPKRPVLDVVREFVQRNGCDYGADPVSNNTVFPEGIVRQAIWNCGGHDGVVQHYREEQIGHCWPSTEPNPDTERLQSQCPREHYVFNGSPVIYEFFSKYSL